MGLLTRFGALPHLMSHAFAHFELLEIPLTREHPIVINNSIIEYTYLFIGSLSVIVCFNTYFYSTYRKISNVVRR